MNMSLTDKARRFAALMHEGQVRKYTGEPYIVHPASVVRILKSINASPSMIAAAWLHDTVEDTDATIQEIEENFGPVVAQLVDELTDKSKPSDGNRATRKAIDRDRLANASANAQTIKLADLLDNTSSITEHDPDFAIIYMKEKEALLGVLFKGNPTLRALCKHVVEEYNHNRKMIAKNSRNT